MFVHWRMFTDWSWLTQLRYGDTADKRATTPASPSVIFCNIISSLHLFLKLKRFICLQRFSNYLCSSIFSNNEDIFKFLKMWSLSAYLRAADILSQEYWSWCSSLQYPHSDDDISELCLTTDFLDNHMNEGKLNQCWLLQY